MKPFLTYEQQLHKLTDEKQLIINNREFAEEKLRDIGYFALIGGYKEPFRDAMTRVYLENTTFEDIYALYDFDNRLRELIFRYICQIEKKIRNIISYSFYEVYGEMQTHYLDTASYNYVRSNQRGIDKLIRMLDGLALTNTDYDYIVHQRNVYQNVPLWVLINAMTFGQISKMYSFLTSRIQSKISKNFKKVNERELEQYLKVLVLYRNVCAHNERLFSHKVYSEIPNTVLHSKLHISQTGNQYNQGKKDLFGVVIAFRYLLSADSFLLFKRELVLLIDKYVRSSSRITEKNLLKQMGFPENWKSITRYRI